jgi:hypothetical protein
MILIPPRSCGRLFALRKIIYEEGFKGDTMLDDFSKADAKVRELRIPLSTVAALCGVSNAELSTLFNRQKPCTSEKAARIWKAVKDISMLVDTVKPIPVDYRRCDALKQAIAKIEQGEAITVGEIAGWSR